MITLLLNGQNIEDTNIISLNIGTKNINDGNNYLSTYGKKILNFTTKYESDYSIISANNAISATDIEFIKNNAKRCDILLACDNDSIEVDALNTSDLISLIKNNDIDIPSIICIKNSILNSLAIDDCRNFEELCLKTIFAITTNALNAIVYNKETISHCSISLDNTIRVKLLRELLTNANIEDLFPNNDWENFAKESATISYHTLCAMFIKYHDLTTAKECLNLCQVFSDSPRSLALRGLIALECNNDLDAVANIVSSLQLYEKRKNEINNIEKINTESDNLSLIERKLNQGLDALNRKDNHKAATIFADAVYNFDNFFKEQNLTKLH